MGANLINGTAQMLKNCSQKYMYFGFVKFHSFHGNPVCDFNEWGHTYKNTQQQLILGYPTWYQIHSQTKYFYLMVRYANYLISIIMNINETQM